MYFGKMDNNTVYVVDEQKIFFLVEYIVDVEIHIDLSVDNILDKKDVNKKVFIQILALIPYPLPLLEYLENIRVYH